MSDRITYPTGWARDEQDKLDALFARARRENLWFHYSGMAGEMWFSPDELQAEQEKGHFFWSADNWRLRDPSLQLGTLDTKIAAFQQERKTLAERMARSRLARGEQP